MRPPASITSFFFNDTATPEIYTRSLPDALPICTYTVPAGMAFVRLYCEIGSSTVTGVDRVTDELQPTADPGCRFDLPSKTQTTMPPPTLRSMTPDSGGIHVRTSLTSLVQNISSD